MEDIAIRGNDFMYPSFPQRTSRIFYNPFPEIRKRRLSPCVKSHIVRHHHHICFRFRQFFFQCHDFFLFRLRHHIIGIQPHTIVLCGFGKRKISCCRKVRTPLEITDHIRIFLRNFLSLVYRPCIHHHDFIGKTFCALQTAFQGQFFIFYNHT